MLQWPDCLLAIMQIARKFPLNSNSIPLFDRYASVVALLDRNALGLAGLIRLLCAESAVYDELLCWREIDFQICSLSDRDTSCSWISL
jgi:hypothetical protein